MIKDRQKPDSKTATPKSKPTASKPSTSTAMSTKDELTFMVFQNELASRSFKVPLSWISRFGLLVGTIILAGVVSIGLAVKFYFIAMRSDATRVAALEQEISTLKKQLEPPVEPEPLTEDQTAAPHEVIEPNARPAIRLFPEKTILDPQPEESVPIRVADLKANLSPSGLSIKFHLDYYKTDGRNQQGRIIILARTNEGLYTYPANLIGTAAQFDALVDPNSGEYFSVSRFRETKAEFSNIKKGAHGLSVDIYIFDLNGKVLISKTLTAKELSLTK